MPNLIPTIVNSPRPNASNKKSVVERCFRCLPKNMVTTAEQKMTTVAVSFCNQLTGRFPINMSRNVPPPIAVTKESTNIPNGSSFFP